MKALSPNRYPKAYFGRERRPMTIVVALVCKDAIVMASDSQTSFEDYTRVDSSKVGVIAFKGSPSPQAIIGHSGSAAWAQYALSLVGRESLQVEPDDYRALPAIVDGVSVKVRNALSERNMAPRDLAFEKMLRENDFSFLMGYYWREKPLLFSHWFFQGASQMIRNYATIGCANEVAEYILRGFCWKPSEYSRDVGIIAATYVVEEIMSINRNCGGETGVFVLPRPGTPKQGKAFRVDPTKIANCVEALRRHTPSQKKARLDELLKLFREVGKQNQPGASAEPEGASSPQ